LEKFDQISLVDITFKRPLMLGEAVSLIASNTGQNKFSILLKFNSLLILKIKIATEVEIESVNNTISVEQTSHKFTKAADFKDTKAISQKMFFEKYYFDLKLLNKTYPNLVNRYDLAFISDLIRATKIVGMEFPGLYSLFSQLSLRRQLPPRANKRYYTIKNFDERFSLYNMDYNSNSFFGVIKAFKRPRQIDQPNFHDLSRITKKNEFALQKALVIGASRGIGELAAKILLAGGADVKGTFYRGQIDANRIIEDVQENNKEIMFTKFNALEPTNQIPQIFESINSLYFFATPSIFVSQKKTLSYPVLNKFMDYYVKAFCQIVDNLCQKNNSSRIAIYYPSSEAVSTHPIDMTEYTIAKQAGELCCEYLSQKYSKLVIYKPRIPRMLTDQTASALHTEVTNSQEYMIKSLREFTKVYQDKK
jgi:hypothetical protein